MQLPTSSRDGGIGRRSRLKICRPLWSWGFDPPSRHQTQTTFDSAACKTAKSFVPNLCPAFPLPASNSRHLCSACRESAIHRSMRMTHTSSVAFTSCRMRSPHGGGVYVKNGAKAATTSEQILDQHCGVLFAMESRGARGAYCAVAAAMFVKLTDGATNHHTLQT